MAGSFVAESAGKSDHTIECPHCHTAFKLTDSLAAPLLAATKLEYDQRLAKKDAEVAAREQTFAEREVRLREEQAAIESKIAERVLKEREAIAIEEQQKAKTLAAAELEQKSKQFADLQEVLKDREAKLTEAQQAQADFLRKTRELEDQRRELELTVEKRVQETLLTVREQTSKEVEDRLKLQMAEKDQLMQNLQKKVEELNRKLEQGSQQLQGEVLELELESILRSKFPFDAIQPVPKGEFGGDVLQRVSNAGGPECGLILWESKRTRNWSDGWVSKLKEDQRAAKADIAVIVSQALPKGVESFDFHPDGVWVVHPKAIVPVAVVLRHSLVEVSLARFASEGQQTKMEQMYQYLTSPRFRLRVEAIVDSFKTMQDDLNAERKAIQRQWAKREKQIESVMLSTVGMWGDLQGIAGRSLQEIDGLSFEQLAPPDTLSAEIESEHQD